MYSYVNIWNPSVILCHLNDAERKALGVWPAFLYCVADPKRRQNLSLPSPERGKELHSFAQMFFATEYISL